MKKRFKSILGLLLAVTLCLSSFPAPALAVSMETDTAAQTEAAQTKLPDKEALDETPPEPAETASSEPDEAIFSKPDEEPLQSDPVSPAPDAALSVPDEPLPEEAPAALQPELAPVKAEPVKVVEKPLVSVVYHYYDDTQSQDVSDFSDYTVSSTHAYYAFAKADGEKITIAANKFPERVPVSTDALRFRVLSHGGEDITSAASYDAASGLVSLPYGYLGHETTVEWYCPASEVAELPVNLTVSVFWNGAFRDTKEERTLPSNTDAIRIPLANSSGFAVSQNGIDLGREQFCLEDGVLSVAASALGGDITVVAYASQSGARTRNTGGGQVAHTCSDDQIYYGYYTHFFTANGNTAFCLIPTAPSIPTGTYPVSRYLQPGTDDLLIKCAYYLYGGPGYDAVKHSLFNDPDALVTYGLCHAAAAYAYLGNTYEAFYGLDASVQGHLTQVLSYIDGLPMPPAGFEAFLYNEGNTSQTFLGWDYVPAGSLEIVKTSGNPAMSAGNSCYSLAGAVFDVYDGNDQKIGSISTDADGKGRLDGIPAGSGYYLMEVKPPQGFAGNSGKVDFSIASSQTTTVTVSNVPQNNPVGILLQKQDADTAASAPQGNAGLAGAEFTVRYYRGAYSKASQLSGLTPDRTWVLKTGADGAAYLDASCLVSGDPFYHATDGAPTIPLGTVAIQETKAPAGYLLSSELFLCQVTGQGTAESVHTYNAPVVKENVVRGGVSIEKWDAELNRKASPQGDASLSGSVLEIVNRSAGSVVVGGKSFAPGAVVHTMTTDDAGATATPANLLPYGSYEVIEKTPPTGYLRTGVIKQPFSIKENGVIVSLRTADKAIKDQVVRGGVEIEKWDVDLNRKAAPQGDAMLEGAVLEIWNRSQNSVLVGGAEYAPNTVVHTLTTNAEGWAGTPSDLLPYGSYEIIEKTPPTGYLNTGVIKQSFAIRDNGIVVSLKTDGKAIKNDVVRGGVEIEKWDIERNERARKQGDATLAGAVFEIWNRSAHSVVVDGTEYAPDAVVHTLVTDTDGWAGTKPGLLPYGSYEIIEKTPPVGYLNTGKITQSFTIRENGIVVSLKTAETAIKNDIIRGGVSVEKWDNEIDEHRAQGGATLENAVFELVNRSAEGVLVQDVLYAPGDVVYTFATGGTGTAVTPDDLLPYGTYEVREVAPPTGYLATGVLSRTFSIREHGVTVELHTTDTAIKNNPIRGDLKGVKVSDGDAKRLANVPFSITSKATGESHVIVTDLNGQFDTSSAWNPHSQNTNRGETDRDGVWFGEARALNDGLGALLFDTYLIEEVRCEANKGYELLSFEVSVYRHSTVVDLGTLTNDHTATPEIFTTARDQATDSNEAAIARSTTIIDTVYYGGLKAGQKYTLKGVLMLKGTGEPLLIAGVPVSAEKAFRASGETGSVSMEFTFDSMALSGKSVVVFESLEAGGAEIASHADLDDEGQTVAFHEPKPEPKEPKIGTSAAGTDGKKEIGILPKVTLIDTVSYENLSVGKAYTLKGTLMDKATGQPLLVDGAKVVAETAFTPDGPNGTTKVTFTFDSLALMGKTVVVFESLELDGVEIAVHADLGDKDQTVTFQEPKIGTTAKAEDGGKTVPIAESVVVIDTVAYENLVPGKEYVLKGVLMDKETAKPLLKDGKPVTAKAAFTPDAPSGSAEVRFTFDSRAIAGRTLVVFESLELEGKEVAAHADINDTAQTVSVGTPKDVPEKPAPTPPEPNAPATPGKAVPQTGDDYSAVLWLVLAALTLSGMLASIWFLCKRRRKALIPLILCAALLAASTVMALGELRQYGDDARAYAKLGQFISSPPDDPAPASSGHEERDGGDGAALEEAGFPASLPPFVDFDGLRAINPDIVGWLTCDGTPLNYPIAQAADNSHYLNHLYDGSRGKAGAPFLDYENAPDFSDRNSIVYGHNLLDGSMFSCLTEYQKQAYYDEHPSMLLITPEGGYRMEVFSILVASPTESGKDTSPWRVTFDTDEDFAPWLSQVKSRSLIQSGVEPTINDNILTLSTCVHGGKDRILVVGRLVAY